MLCHSFALPGGRASSMSTPLAKSQALGIVGAQAHESLELQGRSSVLATAPAPRATNPCRQNWRAVAVLCWCSVEHCSDHNPGARPRHSHGGGAQQGRRGNNKRRRLTLLLGRQAIWNCAPSHGRPSSGPLESLPAHPDRVRYTNKHARDVHVQVRHGARASHAHDGGHAPELRERGPPLRVHGSRSRGEHDGRS